MKKSFKTFICFFIIAFFVVLGCGNHPTNNSAASSNDCIEFNISGISRYLNNHTGMKVKSMTQKSRTNIAGINNFSQQILNWRYNLENNAEINNTCTIVAVTEMLDYFGNFLNEFELESTTETFTRVFNSCIESNLTSIDQGTNKGNVGHCLRTGFQEYESTRSCASDWWNPQGDINNAVGQNVPIMLDLTNHSVVVSGKVTYTVEYEYTHSTGILWWKKDVTETIIRDEDFAIVCEGWGRVNRSVVWFGEITNWWDGGMQATWATSREV